MNCSRGARHARLLDLGCSGETALSGPGPVVTVEEAVVAAVEGGVAGAEGRVRSVARLAVSSLVRKVWNSVSQGVVPPACTPIH
jgi:hypothetical protein